VSERYPEHILLSSQWAAVCDVINVPGFNPSDFARATAYGQDYKGISRRSCDGPLLRPIRSHEVEP
jgi:hypothetical protein